MTLVSPSGEQHGKIERTQVCVFGSGPAGMTLAHSLATQGIDVILIEAGGQYYDPASQDFYRGRVVGDPYFDLSECRLRMFGGTSNHWAGWCRPFEESELSENPNLSITGWPISLKDLAPFQTEASEILEVPNDFQDIEFGPDLRHFMIQFSPPVLFGEKYADFVASSKRLRAYLNSTLIGMSLENNSVRNASIRSHAEGEDTFDWQVEADYYVLCLGGIENSRMLLWINEENRRGLVENHDFIGRFWMEHPRATLGDMLLSEKALPLVRDGFVNFALTTAAHNSLGLAQARFSAFELGHGRSKQLLADLLCTAPETSKYYLSLLFDKNLHCGAGFYSEWEQLPRYDNRVALDEETDQYGVPRPVLYWTRSDFDRKTITEATKLLASQFAELDLGRIRVEEWVADDEAIPEQVQPGGYHHMGGTRMSTDKTHGVVDPDLKVHGSDNLFIGGSSVFPTGGIANPTFTIVQLSLRLGEHLVQKLRL